MSKGKKFIFGSIGWLVSATKKYAQSWLNIFIFLPITHFFLQRLQNTLKFHVFRKSFQNTLKLSLWKIFIYGLENTVSWEFFVFNWQTWEGGFKLFFVNDICCFQQQQQQNNRNISKHSFSKCSRARVSFKKQLLSHALLKQDLPLKEQIKYV